MPPTRNRPHRMPRTRKQAATLVAMGARIRTAREAMGMNQLQVEEKAGWAACTMSHYESGRRGPNLANLRTLCSVLNVDVTWILEGETIDPSVK